MTIDKVIHTSYRAIQCKKSWGWCTTSIIPNQTTKTTITRLVNPTSNVKKGFCTASALLADKQVKTSTSIMLQGLHKPCITLLKLSDWVWFFRGCFGGGAQRLSESSQTLLDSPISFLSPSSLDMQWFVLNRILLLCAWTGLNIEEEECNISCVTGGGNHSSKKITT